MKEQLKAIAAILVLVIVGYMNFYIWQNSQKQRELTEISIEVKKIEIELLKRELGR